MKNLLKTSLACALASGLSAHAQAAQMQIQLTIPRLQATEYHRPYVAVWLESADKQTLRDIAVWYEQGKPQNEGAKWLKDLRQWWRVSGRSQDTPADGVTGATRAAGVHTLNVNKLDDLPAGDYVLSVEAAREKGGRELLRLPLSWPPADAASVDAKGEHELGPVKVELKP